MADSKCFLCEQTGVFVICKPLCPYFCLACEQHTPSKAVLANQKDCTFPAAVALTTNAALATQLHSICEEMPGHVLDELGRRSKEAWTARLVLNPSELVGYKDRNRLFRFFIRAGLTYPNEFIGEAESEELLISMVRTRTSLDVVETAFVHWPVGKEPFRVLQSILRSPYGVVEKRHLFELLLPKYVTLALNRSQKKSLQIAEMIKDKSIKRLIQSYIQYLELLYVLKATELASITRRLPSTLRRYMVETYFSLD